MSPSKLPPKLSPIVEAASAPPTSSVASPSAHPPVAGLGYTIAHHETGERIIAPYTMGFGGVRVFLKSKA